MGKAKKASLVVSWTKSSENVSLMVTLGSKSPYIKASKGHKEPEH